MVPNFSPHICTGKVRPCGVPIECHTLILVDWEHCIITALVWVAISYHTRVLIMSIMRLRMAWLTLYAAKQASVCIY